MRRFVGLLRSSAAIATVAGPRLPHPAAASAPALLHGIDPSIVIIVLRGPASQQARRALCRAVDPIGSSSAEEDISAAEEENAAANLREKKKEKKKKCEVPAAERGLQIFFRRARAIARIVQALQRGGEEWGSELQQAVRSSRRLVSSEAEAEDAEEEGDRFTAQLLVTQVLKLELPCAIALRFFHWLKEQRSTAFEHNQYTYGVMLNALGRAGRVQEMEELLEEMKSAGFPATSVTLSNVVLWSFKAQDMAAIARHWTSLRRSGIRPSPAIYAVYIDLLMKTRQAPKIPALFEEMLRADCLPSSRTYSIFIQHLVQRGNPQAAAKILRSMQRMLVPPNRVAYKAIVVHGFSAAGNADMVLELLKDMAENFVRPTKQFMPAVRCLRAAGKLDAASALVAEIFPDPGSDSGQRIDEAHDDDVVVVVDDDDDDDDDDDEDSSDSEPPMTAWRSVHSSHPGFDVNAFCRAIREWNPQVEETLEQESIQWESSLVTEILRRTRCLRSAWKFFFWLKNKAFFRHDSYTAVLLIRRILKSTIETERKENLIRELFERMRKHGMVFTVPMFNVVMRHFLRMGETEKALNMLKLTEQFKVEPNDISYRLVIQGYAKDREGKKATRLLEEMEGKGFALDDEARAEMITCLSLAGKIERAYALFTSSWEASGTSASAVEWKAIIAAYARVGDNAMALQLYERMRAVGIKPTQDMYELATEILRKANRLSDVQELAQERALLKFFGGTKKALQEKLLEVLFLFMEGIQQRSKSTTATITTTTGSASVPGGHSAKMQTE